MTEIPSGTVAARLALWAGTEPDKPAYIFRGTETDNERFVLTRGDLWNLSRRFAAIVRDAGVQKGEVVCNTLPNSPERLITDLGLMVAGAVAMNGVVYLADGADLMKCLTKATVVAMVVDPHQKKGALTVLRERLVEPESGILKCPGAPSIRKVFHVDCARIPDGNALIAMPWLRQLKQKERMFVEEGVDSGDRAFIFTIPGSTAYTTLVPRSHKQFIFMGEVCHDLMCLQSDAILFNERAFGWMGGSCFDYLARGITRVLVDMTLPPGDLLGFCWDCVFAERCSVVSLIPPHITESLERPQLWEGKNPKVNTIFTGGMPVTKEQAQAAGMISQYVIITYSIIEAGFITQKIVTEKNKQQYHDGDMGKPFRSYRVKIFNDRGQEIDEKHPGVVGEVLVKGSQLFNGYLDNCMVDMSMKQQCFGDDGWYRTTDVGFYNRKGNLHIVCRKCNAIIRGVHIIYPEWLEQRIEKCPGVNECVIVPVPDPKMYQEMCCCIVRDETRTLNVDRLASYCKSLFSGDAGPEEIQVPPKHILLILPGIPETRNGNQP
ncbi:hypothetical protein V1264_018969 [Littorina saxatilis]|uniref:Uncharacterized protein n=1 Tax=Littorina saxatilis TaxID=31220 RepID=A0AAN9BDV8_9CAEN